MGFILTFFYYYVTVDLSLTFLFEFWGHGMTDNAYRQLLSNSLKVVHIFFLLHLVSLSYVGLLFDEVRKFGVRKRSIRFTFIVNKQLKLLAT